MDPASVFILLVVIVAVIGLGVFLLFTSAGLELREGRRRGRRQRRPEHMRVENEQQAVSSPTRSGPAPPPPRP